MVNMTDRTFIVRYKPPETSTQPVVAARAEIDGDYLVLINSKGELAAMFLLKVVESWEQTDEAVSG
jgi:hypothetical protein